MTGNVAYEAGREAPACTGGSVSIRSPRRIDIDDDAAADIIKRARPALERARELYACWL
jgi:Arc/MetJ family transcription regulator